MTTLAAFLTVGTVLADTAVDSIQGLEAWYKIGTPNGRVPIVGVVEDLSIGGAKIRCRNAGHHLETDQYAYLHLELPEPVGTIEALVRICTVSPSRVSGHVNVSVAFDKPVETLEEFIRQIDIRRALRRRRVG